MLVRSFVAIELPAEVKDTLTRIQAQFKRARLESVRWVDPNNIHLTLKFLGDINSDRVGEIIEALSEAAGDTSPFSLTVAELGVFPSPKRIQIVWVGLGGDTEQLAALQKHVESNLSILGFPPEGRAFTPHLTLARVRDFVSPEERERLAQLIVSAKIDAAPTFKVECIKLMRSDLTRQGPIYTELGAVSLKKS